jgi:DNA-binding response OmpR family regulator
VNTRQILYIDDDDDDQEFFQFAVNQISDGIHCIITHDARLALHKLTTREWVPDIIFLDLNMPVMTGRQFLEEARKRKELNVIPVVILSTSAQLSTIRLMKEEGAQDFVTKPSSVHELAGRLKLILRLNDAL